MNDEAPRPGESGGAVFVGRGGRGMVYSLDAIARTRLLGKPPNDTR